MVIVSENVYFNDFIIGCTLVFIISQTLIYVTSIKTAPPDHDQVGLFVIVVVRLSQDPCAGRWDGAMLMVRPNRLVES